MWPWMRLLDEGRSSRTPAYGADQDGTPVSRRVLAHWHEAYDEHLERHGDDAQPEAVAAADAAVRERFGVRAARLRPLLAIAVIMASTGVLLLGAAWNEPTPPLVAPSPPAVAVSPPLPEIPQPSTQPHDPYIPPRITRGAVDVPDRRSALPDADVYLLPLGRTKPGLVERAARRATKQLGIDVTVLPAIDAPTRGARRGELWDSETIRVVDRVVPAARGPEAPSVIGVTELDIGIPMYSDIGWGTTVISTAKLDPVNYGLPAWPKRLDERIYKLVLRAIGAYYFGLPPSDEQRSPVYGRLRWDFQSIDMMQPELLEVPE
jgi:hypothetical protein